MRLQAGRPRGHARPGNTRRRRLRGALGFGAPPGQAALVSVWIIAAGAAAIARHAGQRGSGRVGRSAAGRALDEEAITLAVVASVRHEDTDYDSLLMSGVPREIARGRVRAGIDRVLAAWAK